MRNEVRFICALGVLLSAALPLARADRDALRFGMSAPLTGASEDFGNAVRLGLELALGEANRGGGVRGHRLDLLALDDRYEPSKAVANVERLIEREGVLGVVGCVGTPTAVATIPIAVETRTPFIGAITGAGVLRRSPPERYVVNFRASYAQEMAQIARGLTEHAGVDPGRVAFFTQNDAFGEAGYHAGVNALADVGLDDASAVPHGRYIRNTIAVEHGLADILETGREIEAVVLVGTSEPSAKFIRLAREYGLDAVFVALSFVDASSLCEALGDEGRGVFVTQVVPSPEAALPLCEAFRDAAVNARTGPMGNGPMGNGPMGNGSMGDGSAGDGSAGRGASHATLEGYAVGRMLVDALGSIEGTIDKEALIDAFEAMGEADLGLGEPITLGPRDHQASDAVYLTEIVRSGVRPADWERMRRRGGGPGARSGDRPGDRPGAQP